MKLDRNQIFRELTPPAGGAARMRARFAAERGDVSRSDWHFAAAGVAAVLLIGVLVAIATRPATDAGSSGGELYASADFDRLLGRASTPYALSVSLDDERLDLTEIPTRDPQVRFVRIGDSSAN